MSAPALLQVHGLHHAYAGGQVVAIQDIGFDVPEGEVVCIVGPSGCGKSTLLRILAGLMGRTAGSVRFGGEDVCAVPVGLAMVFQEYGRSLLPWMRVAANVELPLRYQPLSPAERRSRVGDSLEAVGLAHAAGRYPWQLSGGMQQRVAIARALAYRPRLLLMDEPFASVDAQTRSDLEDLVLELRRRYGMTVLVVTHDIDEAVYLADHVVVLSTSPSRVLTQIEVPLGTGRDQINTKADPRFVEIRSEVARLIRRT